MRRARPERAASRASISKRTLSYSCSVVVMAEACHCDRQSSKSVAVTRGRPYCHSLDTRLGSAAMPARPNDRQLDVQIQDWPRERWETKLREWGTLMKKDGT